MLNDSNENMHNNYLGADFAQSQPKKRCPPDISSSTGTNLSMSNLLTSVFKLAKFDFSAKLEVSTCEIFLISAFVAELDKSTLTLISPPNGSDGSFLSIQLLIELSYPFHLRYSLFPFF